MQPTTAHNLLTNPIRSTAASRCFTDTRFQAFENCALLMGGQSSDKVKRLLGLPVGGLLMTEQLVRRDPQEFCKFRQLGGRYACRIPFPIGHHTLRHTQSGGHLSLREPSSLPGLDNIFSKCRTVAGGWAAHGHLVTVVVAEDK